MHPTTLYLAGSLCPRALHKHLQNAGPEDLVLEFDTLLDHQNYPNVRHWSSPRELLQAEVVADLRQKTDQLIHAYVSLSGSPQDRAGDEDLRRAGVTASILDATFSHLVNSHLYEQVVARMRLGRIVATAGCGINFGFWRQIAEVKNLEIELVQPETFRRGLARWWEKKRYKRLARALARQAESAVNIPLNLSSSSGLPWVFCASNRVARLMQLEGMSAGYRMRQLDWKDLDQPEPAFVRAESTRLTTCLQKWFESLVDHSDSAGNEELRQFAVQHGPALLSVTENNLARWSVMRDKAVKVLEAKKPQLLLTDTQIAEDEIIWSLAARSLSIPVVAYSYDFIVNIRTAFVPDWVLADGMRTIPRALMAGYPEHRMVNVRSHRRPSNAPRSIIEDEAVYAASQPLILFADPLPVAAESRLSVLCCRVLIEAARQMPNLKFVIKFHPLRGNKTEERSFVSMDESELAAKMRFIKSQNPPSNVSCLAPEASMEEYLRNAAVLLSTNSMSGHEAFHLGVPVIFLCQRDRDSVTFPKLSEHMTPFHAGDSETLVKQLNQLLRDPGSRRLHVAAQRRYLDEFYWPSKTTLTEAVSSLLNAPESELVNA